MELVKVKADENMFFSIELKPELINGSYDLNNNCTFSFRDNEESSITLSPKSCVEVILTFIESIECEEYEDGTKKWPPEWPSRDELSEKLCELAGIKFVR